MQIRRFIHVYISRELAKQKAPNTTTAEFANTVDPDETAQNEPSHLDIQFWFFNMIQLILKVFRNFAGVILSSAFFWRFTKLRIDH